MSERGFLACWTVGSAAATLFGLGAGGLIALMGLHEGRVMTAVPAAVVLSVAIALTVGLLQGILLADRVSGASALRWAAATGAGTLAAWAVIAYPVLVLTAPDSGALPWTTVVFLAAGVGGAGGALVGTAQLVEVGRHSARAARSIPLLAAAWAIGALVLFCVSRLMAELTSQALAVPLGAAVLLVAGALAGAIQGAGLVRILPAAVAPTPAPRSMT